MKITIKKTLIAFIITSLSITSFGQGLKTSGRKIVDTNGTEVILRSMGLGGWMIQEPYMMEMSGIAGTQWQIKDKIMALIGEANTTAYFDAWHANHCTKGDIDSLSSWGFNSVRLPMHYNLYTLPVDKEPVSGANTWLDKGFALTDSLIKWCSARHIYVILDLHAAPGGQGHDAAISDYDASKLSLWESSANRLKTIALWKKLAERYVNEPWVGGYDLINEPNWNFATGGNVNGCDETSNVPLRQLLIDITAAIRQVDQNHIIIIEGNCWGNNYNGILPAWDNNMVVSFHKYWSNNDQGSIQGMLNIRTKYNIPLWLGESGENSNPWFTSAIKLAESNGIGWAWWPLKKVNSVVNPLTIKTTTQYETLINYWKNGGTAPTAGFATDALMQLAGNARIENCIYRKDVIDAMFRQVYDFTAKPFLVNQVPGVLHATDYDLGRNKVAYSDTDTADFHVSSGTYTAWNTGYSYRNDAVDIESSTDTDASSNGYNVGWTANNEWLQFTTEVDSSAAYDVTLRYAYAGSGSIIRLSSDNADITTSQSLASTGGNQVWKNITLNDVILYKGNRELRVIFEKGGCNLGSIKFTLSKPISEVTTRAVSAETYKLSQLIYINFNIMPAVSTVTTLGFSCTLNGNPVNFAGLAVNDANPSQVILSLDQEIFDSDDIKLSYADGLVKATDGTSLMNFSNLQVKNNLPLHLQIPGKIEAEAFSVNQGLSVEACTDAGGGQDVGYTNIWDFLDYNVRIINSGKYNMVLRIACCSAEGIVQVQQLNDIGDVLNSATVNIPVTGGWHTWKSVNAEIRLTAGIGRLRYKIIQPEFNMNWFSFELSQGIPEMASRGINIFPNPVTDNLTIEIPGSAGQLKTLYFRTLNGTLVKEKALSGQESQTITISDLAPGFYFLELEMAGVKYRGKFIRQ